MLHNCSVASCIIFQLAEATVELATDIDKNQEIRQTTTQRPGSPHAGFL
jgi:hypothetical protein